MVRVTPFHARTGPLLAEHQHTRRWGGYFVASAYDSTHDREFAAIRNAAALFDVTPLWKYVVEGRDAARLLDRIVTRDVTKAKVGQVLYTTWCNAQGKIIDDGTVSRLGDTRFRLTSAEPSLRWLELNAAGLDVSIRDVTFELAALALQGPRSRAILAALVGGEVESLKYFRVMSTSIDGAAVDISRTGYTGDLGFELWMKNADALTVWDALARAGRGHGLTPAGIWALDVARIEAGLVMADVDYVPAPKAITKAQLSSPYELGLGWTVAEDKGPFVGQAALRAEKARGSAWQLVGVEVDWPSLEALYLAAGVPPHLPTVAFRSSVPLFAEERQIGYASCGCWSPLQKKFIALCHVEAAYAAPGTPLMMDVIVEHYRRQALARVVPLPFFNPERKRK